MDLKTRIFTRAAELFMKYGVKSVSMDDIARGLGVSKKTLYTCVENKADLIHKVLLTVLENEHKEIEEIKQVSQNAVDEMIRINKYVLQFLRKMKPSLTFDLQKYYPQTWKIIDEEHLDYIKDTIQKNISRGVKEEFYRSHVNPYIISEMYVSISRLLNNEDVFPTKEFNKLELYTEQVYYHLNGIVNANGRTLLKTYLKELAQ